MKLGAFSISLAVNDIAASKAFYETLGFEVFGGNIEQNWLMMRNDSAVIGLFQGMFENNLLTFNPGWNNQAENLDEFDDVRDIQAHLKANSIALDNEITEDNTAGPAHIALADPDGNAILIDQHR